MQFCHWCGTYHPYDSDKRCPEKYTEGMEISKRWISRHPEYVPSEEMAQKIGGIVADNGWQWNIENLDRAYHMIKGRIFENENGEQFWTNKKEDAKEIEETIVHGKWGDRTTEDCIFLRQCGIDPEYSNDKF